MTRLLVLSLLMLMAFGAAAQEKSALPDTETLSRKPIHFVSKNEQFQATFPSGCGKIYSRKNEPDLFAGEDYDDIVLVEFASCDRYQEKGEGVSISATFNYHDKEGNMAGPDQVVRRVEEALGKFGAMIVEQKPVQRDYGDQIVAEGVRVFALGTDGKGEVVIMGLLSDGDIYVLSAWNVNGGLMKDPEIRTFFDSFRPFVE